MNLPDLAKNITGAPSYSVNGMGDKCRSSANGGLSCASFFQGTDKGQVKTDNPIPPDVSFSTHDDTTFYDSVCRSG